MHGLVIPFPAVTDMANVLLFLAGYMLGIGSCVVFIVLMFLHRPRYEAPTLHRRRYRDLPIPEAKPEAVEERPIYMHGIMGLSDEE